MIKEMYQQIVVETTLNVTQSKIDSIRNKTIKKTGCRVYENRYIGVAGTLGEATEETWKQAEANLSLKIPYEYEPEKNHKRTRDLRNTQISRKDFIEKTEYILEALRKEFPEFIFSNKIKMVEKTEKISNDCGLEYINMNSYIGFDLIYKHINSVNVFDSGIFPYAHDMDVDKILKEARVQLKAFNHCVELPDCKTMPVVLDYNYMLPRFMQALNSVAIGTNTSMFNDKMGKKVFNEDFNMFVDRTSEMFCTPFFDKEGSVLSGDKFNLIENGVIKTGYTDKKNSKKYNMQNTASAGGEYDDVPSIAIDSLSITPSDKTLNEIIEDKEAILVIMMSGGDCTNEGIYASPVQMSYLIKNGEIVGKLPEFNISASIYDAFGTDFLGVTADKPLFGQRVLVANMNISK